MGLTVKGIAKLTKARRYRDGRDHPGLYLQITPAGVRSWLLRFERNGRERFMGLGPLHTVSLSEARVRARAARLKLLDGIDPIDHRKKAAEASAVEAAKHKTFAEVAGAYLEAHARDWTNAKHARQWQTSLTKDCKAIANLPIAAIDTAHILEVLRPIWHRKPETASRTRARIERVIAYAVAAQYRKRTDANPARWDGHLQELLGKKSAVKRAKRERTGKDGHLPAMPYAEVPGFLAELRQRPGIAARALEFTILTAGRSGEVLGGRWDEVDLEAGTWTVPAGRMKEGVEHRVPLSSRAREILQAVPREANNPYLFIGQKRGAPLAHMGMLKLLAGSGVTVHGFRSSFRDWCAERTNYPREVAEMALAHTIPDAVERAYRRGDLFEKRRQLMTQWARYCSSSPVAGEVVVSMRRGAK
jgi:integrase